MEKFFITLRKFNNRDDKITLYLTPTGHALSNLWVKTIKENFLNENNNTNSKGLNKMFCFHGWQQQWEQPEYSRNLEVLCNDLNYAIDKVNEFYGPVGYPHIESGFSLDNLQDMDWYRHSMNVLHHHFELLIGQVENVSDWFYKPNSHEACYYVTQLNFLLHEIEAIVNLINKGNGEKSIYVCYTGPRADGSFIPEPVRIPLELEHYECFENVEHKWGMLVAFYSQLGKQHIEVYMDDDEEIHDENISGISWMLGESILALGNTGPDDPSKERVSGKYKEWLIANGFDITDPTLALGLGVLANMLVDDNTHLGETWQEIDTTIHQYDDVYEVGFIDTDTDEVVVSQVYDFTWKDYKSAVEENLKGKLIHEV